MGQGGGMRDNGPLKGEKSQEGTTINAPLRTTEAVYGLKIEGFNWWLTSAILRMSKTRIALVLLACATIFCVTVGAWIRLGPVYSWTGQDAFEGMPDHPCSGPGILGKLEVFLVYGRGLPVPDNLLRPFGMVVVDGKLYDWYQARIGWDVQWGQAALLGTDKENPYWSPDSRRYYCIMNTTKSIELQIWDDNIVNDNILVGSVPLNVTEMMKEQPRRGLFNAEQLLNLVSPSGRMAGKILVETRFYSSRDLSEIIDTLDTGDILLFSGATVNGNFIKASTKSEWSHVGLVYRDNTSVLKMVESSTNHAHMHDCDTGDVKWGVQKVSLVDKVYSSFYDKVAVRRLNLVDDVRGSPSRLIVDEELHEFYKSKRGLQYEEFKLEMVKAHFNWNTANNESRDTLFCSEFVAQAYLRLGLFNSENIPSNVLQWEFSSENWMGEGLGNGAHLENEIYLRDVQRYPAGKCYERPETCECGPQDKPYSETYACMAPPCGSIWKLVWGGMIDLGLGFSIETLITVLGLGWVLVVVLSNICACWYISTWLGARRKIIRHRIKMMDEELMEDGGGAGRRYEPVPQSEGHRGQGQGLGGVVRDEVVHPRVAANEGVKRRVSFKGNSMGGDEGGKEDGERSVDMLGQLGAAYCLPGLVQSMPSDASQSWSSRLATFDGGNSYSTTPSSCALEVAVEVYRDSPQCATPKHKPRPAGGGVPGAHWDVPASSPIRKLVALPPVVMPHQHARRAQEGARQGRPVMGDVLSVSVGGGVATGVPVPGSVVREVDGGKPLGKRKLGRLKPLPGRVHPMPPPPGGEGGHDSDCVRGDMTLIA